MKLHILPALSGDSLMLGWQGISGLKRNILIDGGVTNTYNQILRNEIKSLLDKTEIIDLVILTHIDSDHIGGILRIVTEIELGKLPHELIYSFWFNSARVLSNYFQTIASESNEIELPHIDNEISKKQGNTLESLLNRLKIETNHLPIFTSQEFMLDGLKIDILSPDIANLQRLSKNWQTEIKLSTNIPISGKPTDYHVSIQELVQKDFQEDSGIPNGSSIAVLVTFEKVSLLLLADAPPSVVIKSLLDKGYSITNKLKVDYMKISHHGSKYNTSEVLLDIIDCTRFIISTNGSALHGLPHKEALAKIVYHNHQRGKDTELIFNYQNAVLTNIFTQDEMKEFNFKTTFQNQIYI